MEREGDRQDGEQWRDRPGREQLRDQADGERLRDQADGDRLGDRPDGERLRDHAAIDRLSDELLPALIAKLGATGLGEIEVREGDWKVRLRRPADGQEPPYGRRATDRASRAQPGHAGHGHAPAAVESHRSARGGRENRPASAGGASEAGSAGAAANGVHVHLAAVGPGFDPGARVGRMGHLPEGERSTASAGVESYLAVAVSPAVGIFHPKAELRTGARVRAGDRLGVVDVLGVPQPVVAPVDGLVGATLVDPGDAVEYGQDLIRIELAEPAAQSAPSGHDSDAGPAADQAAGPPEA
ncbi:MAG TPA: hypothetical protein VIV06_02980 [Candidatus Limnocylindrales bacterium]